MNTAVEWLVNEMIQRGFFDVETELSYTTLEHLTNQAKEMEKEQIIKSVQDANKTYFWVKYEGSEDYYNKTFKK